MVEDVSFYGQAKGVTRGGAPNVRIAVYKVCWSTGCTPADIFAAFDDAIADGVDIISIATGPPMLKYSDDVVAIGSFHAMKKGILTVAAAGNFGPLRAIMVSPAPWLLTVAASTIDRKFVLLWFLQMDNALR